MNHLTIGRMWDVSHGNASWDESENEHLRTCAECAKLFDLVKAEREGAPDGLSRPEWGCPPEERVAAFLDGGMAEEEAAKVREHLSTCRWCLRAALERLRTQGSPEIPPPSPPSETPKPPEEAVFVTDDSNLEEGLDADEAAAPPEQEMVIEQAAIPTDALSAPSVTTEAVQPVPASALRRFWPHVLSIVILGAVLAALSLRGAVTPERRVKRAIERADAFLAKGNAKDARSVLESALGRADLSASHVEQLRSAMERCFAQASDPKDLNDAIEKGYASLPILSRLAKVVADGKATVRPTVGAALVAKIIRETKGTSGKAPGALADVVVKKILDAPPTRVVPVLSADRVMADLLALRAERKGDLAFLRVSAKCLIEAGLRQDALQRFKAIADKQPDDPAARAELVALYWQLGMKQEMKNEVETLLSLK